MAVGLGEWVCEELVDCWCCRVGSGGPPIAQGTGDPELDVVADGWVGADDGMETPNGGGGDTPTGYSIG